MQTTEVAKTARQVASVTARAPTPQKNAALKAMAARLESCRQQVRHANEADLAEAMAAGMRPQLVDRLRFGDGKIDARIRCLHKIVELPDPVGEVFREDERPNGLRVARVRVPLGVILMVYEPRPHVTVNAGAFCLKSGNAAILRGGSEAKHCNGLLGELWKESLAEAGLPTEAIQVVCGGHEDIEALLGLDEYIDLVIPRGGKGLIEAVSRRSRIPVIKHYAGVCHVYVDKGADIRDSIAIALDSKCLMPEVCNAMETLLVHREQAGELPRIVSALKHAGVTVRGCLLTRSVVPEVEPASEDDWRTEYLDSLLAVRVVKNIEEAVRHINTYGSHHTDAIVTADESRAQQFVDQVDSAVVLVNASTMFCDGESLGMGAEIGISTDKLHARGPMGLEELTSYKFVIRGNGHVMGGEAQ
ncbi:MAG: hypothetical protein AMK72_02075 [Planctomycetes bacterium SM23_25]|nr:MAG: hypothetical protein AMK72_02075 [Planctomycetes bacterium SM23_25]